MAWSITSYFQLNIAPIRQRQEPSNLMTLYALFPVENQVSNPIFSIVVIIELSTFKMLPPKPKIYLIPNYSTYTLSLILTLTELNVR